MIKHFLNGILNQTELDKPEQIAEKAKDDTYLSPILSLGLADYKNWSSLTTVQKDTVLKGILGYLLRKEKVI